MKLKLVIIFCLLFAYLTFTTLHGGAAAACGSISFPLCNVLFDGVKPPHAVDISGKVIPESSTTQPDKPIILAKDSDDSSRGQLKPEAAFDHSKHSTDVTYSLDGKTVTTCVECHHTDQPTAPKGQDYLTKMDRKEVLTAKQLETSKQAVNSCRVCHFKESTEPTDVY